MNEVITQLYERKPVRRFTDQPISQEEKNLILNAALQAPTAGNMSMFSILDIQDEALKARLADLCDHQPFIRDAPLVLVFLADFEKWDRLFKNYGLNVPDPTEADLFLAMEDCLIAAQNSVTAAWSMKIGSCYIGDILENFETIQTLLNLPKYAVPCTMVVFGHPTVQQMERIKPPRFAIEDLVFTDTYQQKSDEQIKEMFKRKHDLDKAELEEWTRAFSKRKFEADFKAEMDRSVKAILESWTNPAKQ